MLSVFQFCRTGSEEAMMTTVEEGAMTARPHEADNNIYKDKVVPTKAYKYRAGTWSLGRTRGGYHRADGYL